MKNSKEQLDLFGGEKNKDVQNYTEEQNTFINYDGKNSIALLATAGSGKTFSCIKRVQRLIDMGVDPSKIIFFSFTNAAVDEFKLRLKNDAVKVTTIHAFCYHILAKAGRARKILNFKDFIDWYKEKFKPRYASEKEQHEHDRKIHEMYEEMETISSKISAFKLQTSDGIKVPMPDYFMEYIAFQKEKKLQDFSDMLIEVDKLFKEDKWLKMFKNKYDYIFIDEFQDTSTIQLKVLLSLNAKYYYLIGDENQSIFGFSGSNSEVLIAMLSERRKLDKMTLTLNFRSDINIVENANKFSKLTATPTSKELGDIDYNMIFDIQQLKDVLNLHQEVAVLVRTNKVIKQLEKKMLAAKYPLRYFNYITAADVENFKKGEISPFLKRKVNELMPEFSSASDIFGFIELNKNSKKFITTIHKSKGREYDACVVVNSVDPQILKDADMQLPQKLHKKVSFVYNDEDREAQNIHYVAVTRPRHNLYFMLYGEL
jgi:superfamily I DNA/RNA helicase